MHESPLKCRAIDDDCYPTRQFRYGKLTISLQTKKWGMPTSHRAITLLLFRLADEANDICIIARAL